MKPEINKNSNQIISICTILFLSISYYASGKKQDTLSTSQRLSIELPLRFSYLQSKPTMLSGLRIGKQFTSRINVALSIYHSFYLKSFKPQADLTGFDEQPRLFINCVGGEIGFKLYERRNFSLWTQSLFGWGFMKYDLGQYNFKSKPLHYPVAEPSLNGYYKLKHAMTIGLGLGFRPLLSKKHFQFSSDRSEGQLPVSRSLPNGINLILTFSGYL